MIKPHFYLGFLLIFTKTLRGVQTVSYKCLFRSPERWWCSLFTLESVDSMYMKENKRNIQQRQMCSAPLPAPRWRLWWKPFFFFFFALCVSFSSCHLNTVSHTVPSLPDGPWPSQPYLHLLAGPTSYHRGRLLAGNTHLYSPWSFIFHFFFPLQRWRLGKNPVRAALSQIFFFFFYVRCEFLWDSFQSETRVISELVLFYFMATVGFVLLILYNCVTYTQLRNYVNNSNNTFYF